MATLVLTTVGGVLGGPIGAAVGALIGQSIDAQLLAPKGRDGPRLSDLRVQTSSYGTPIPRVMGRMRMAGTVIWSTDLIEHRQKSGGKGRPKTTTYSYSVSLAVALSSRPIARIGRIWAEGNLLRGADGRFTSDVRMRLHRGGEDQAVDPLIAAAEGIAACPAYRGIAYAVLEDFDLAPFGNRIPSLTFETVADDGAVRLIDIARDALGTAVAGVEGPVFDGWVLSATSRGATLAGLQHLGAEIYAHPVTGWYMAGGDALTATLGEAAVTAKGEGERIHHPAADARPAAVVMAAFEPARDFQSVLQSAEVAGGAGAVQRLDLPAAMGADGLRGLALSLADRVGDVEVVRERPTGFGALAIPPGSRVALLDGATALLRERRIEGDHLMLQLEADAPLHWRGGVAADGGRHVASPDYGPVATTAAVFDLPRADGTEMSGGLVLAASGTGPGWRGAAVELTPVAGGVPVALPAVTEPALIGVVTVVDAVPQSVQRDTTGSITVALVRPDYTLANASDVDVLAGANLAVVGDEVLQFGVAEPLGAGRWRLSRLLRGRLGTEDAMAALAPGADFALIDDTLVPIPQAAGMVPVAAGGQLTLGGVGDAAEVMVPIRHVGRALRPLSPAHARWQWRDDGALMLGWTRRSSGGFVWLDGIDAPQDDDGEHYRVEVSSGGVRIVVIRNAPEWVLDAAEVAAMRAAGSTLSIEIYHIGQRADSLPLTLTLPL